VAAEVIAHTYPRFSIPCSQERPPMEQDSFQEPDLFVRNGGGGGLVWLIAAENPDSQEVVVRFTAVTGSFVGFMLNSSQESKINS
jgi:hypothetical protein